MKYLSSLLLTLCTLLLPASALALSPQVVASFNAATLESPENLWIDRDNNVYITLALTGEVRLVAADGSQAPFLQFDLGAPPLTPCFPGTPLPVPAITGITGDNVGNLYFGVKSCDPTKSGVWRLTRSGSLTLIFPQGPSSLFNGMDFYRGDLYFADSFLNVVWKIDADAVGSGGIWSNDPLLQVDPASGLPGPNGLKVFRGEVYVSVSASALIVKTDANRSDTAGPVSIHAAGAPCDDFAFDAHGALYCGTDPFGTLLKIDQAGAVTTLLTVADGLDGPTATFFGNGAQSTQLYITNGAFPFFSTTHNPTLMRLDVGVPGAP